MYPGSRVACFCVRRTDRRSDVFISMLPYHFAIHIGVILVDASDHLYFRFIFSVLQTERCGNFGFVMLAPLPETSSYSCGHAATLSSG